MAPPAHVLEFRVRYCEIDQMGTFYNSRALDWFESGRTEFLRSIGRPYTQMEAQGLFLPVVEAHLDYRGRAAYDQLLRMTTTAAMSGKARLRFDVSIVRADDARAVVQGYTVHAIVDRAGKPMRPPAWLAQELADGAAESV
jgi:acyl-CoA thioester hydrolase